MRNILQVSLVVQKPIVPELFLHSLEAILPVHSIPANLGTEKTAEATLQLTVAAMKEQETSLALQANLSSGQNLPPHSDGLSAAGDQGCEEDTKLKKRIATQHALTTARNKFALELPEIWKDFNELIFSARGSADSLLWQQATATAHKLKGSTGSYGFSKLSQVCDKLENLLICLDPTCPTEQDLLWSEINRGVDEGMDCVNRVGTEVCEDDKTDQPRLSILAVVPEEGQSLHALKQLASVNHWAFIEYANSVKGAQLKCHDNRFDALIVDLALDSVEGRFEIIKALRAIPGYSNAPILFICNKEYSPAQLTYAGSSASIKASVNQNELNACLKQLVTICESRKSRILCIDDDRQLTRFIEGILSDEGFSVHSLNEPIVTLEEVDRYNPDLILLDILMPGISGFDVCRMLKAHDSSARTPILFLTAKYDTTSRSCAFQAGAEDFLAKPVLRNELLARIKAHLPQKKSDDFSYQSALVTKECFYRISNRLMCELTQAGKPSTALVLSVHDQAQLNLLQGPFACQQVTSMIARILSLRFRPEDIRTQLEEDRFAVFSPGTNMIEADEIITSLLDEFTELWFANNHGETFQPTISIQKAAAGYDGNSIEDLIEVCVEQIRQSKQ